MQHYLDPGMLGGLLGSYCATEESGKSDQRLQIHTDQDTSALSEGDTVVSDPRQNGMQTVSIIKQSF